MLEVKEVTLSAFKINVFHLLTFKNQHYIVKQRSQANKISENLVRHRKQDYYIGFIIDIYCSILYSPDWELNR